MVYLSVYFIATYSWCLLLLCSSRIVVKRTMSVTMTVFASYSRTSPGTLDEGCIYRSCNEGLRMIKVIIATHHIKNDETMNNHYVSLSAVYYFVASCWGLQMNCWSLLLSRHYHHALVPMKE